MSPATQPVSHRFLLIRGVETWQQVTLRGPTAARCAREAVQLTQRGKREGQRETQSSVTQFTARDLLQHEREKATQAESVSKPALRLLHVNTFVLELCQPYCEGGKMTQVRSLKQHMRVM